MLRWCDRRWRCRRPCSANRVKVSTNTGMPSRIRNHAEPSDKREIEERRLKTPLRNPPRHDTGDRRGGNQKKTADPRTAKPLVMMLLRPHKSQRAPAIATRFAIAGLIVAAGDWGDKDDWGPGPHCSRPLMCWFLDAGNDETFRTLS